MYYKALTHFLPTFLSTMPGFTITKKIKRTEPISDFSPLAIDFLKIFFVLNTMLVLPFQIQSTS
ncbi:hypothetical protein D1109_10910 [Actinobacillus pleuropneumoniae]|nr:hypothetical protein D1109_10910 [Actinobacillus pleuropneumoniae]